MSLDSFPFMKKNSSYTVYGIPNCDTVKKARTALEKNQIQYQFVDFKKTPPSEADILRWKAFVKGWPVNTKGPTYRKIKEDFEAASESQKMKILIANSSAIKRPILEVDGKVQCLGFDPEIYK